MRDIRTLCDAEGCGKPLALQFSFFHERKADGAGGMEDWDWTFDLCPAHQAALLHAILESIERVPFTLEQAKKFTERLNIKARLG